MPQIDPAISLLISLGLGLLFAAAALHKLLGWRQFRDTLANYRLLPSTLVAPAAAALVGAETAVVALLATPGLRRVGLLLAAGLIALYALAMGCNLWRGHTAIDCGCLGVARRQHLQWWMVGRNGALGAAALIAALPVAARSLGALDVLTIVLGAASLAVLYVAYDLLGALPSRPVG